MALLIMSLIVGLPLVVLGIDLVRRPRRRDHLAAPARGGAYVETAAAAAARVKTGIELAEARAEEERAVLAGLPAGDAATRIAIAAARATTTTSAPGSTPAPAVRRPLAPGHGADAWVLALPYSVDRTPDPRPHRLDGDGPYAGPERRRLRLPFVGGDRRRAARRSAARRAA